MQFGSKGESAMSKLTMAIIGDRFILRGPCFVDSTTKSVAMYIPKSDKYDYLPALPRTDKKATEPINGNIRAWVSSLTDPAQPIGELKSCFSKIFTIEHESEIEYQAKHSAANLVNQDAGATEDDEADSSDSPDSVHGTETKQKKKKKRKKKSEPNLAAAVESPESSET